MPDGQEFEIKLAIEPSVVEPLLAHPLLAEARGGRRLSYLISTYFDTPDLALHSRRISLRLRKSEGGTRQTLKHETFSRIDREEFESETTGTTPDVAWLRSTPLAPLLEKPGIAEALEPQFTVEVARTILPISFEGARIEGALDQGTIRAKGLSIPVGEFELELKEGSQKSVLALARRLARELPLMLSLAAKSERGYGIRDLSWGHPTKAIAVALDADATIAEGFQEIVQGCLHAVTVNAALIGGAETGEAVHKARVALRRLRSALQLFKPVLAPETARSISQELKWMSARLGAARDADVFQDGLARLRNGAAPEGIEAVGLEAVDNVMRCQRDGAHRKLEKALASARWRVALLDLLAFSMDGVRPSARDDDLAPFVKDRLKSRRRKLAKATKRLDELPADELHEVRKAVKGLRYSLEFFDGIPKLGAGKKPRRLVGRLTTLQESIGVLNDEAAFRDHLRATFVDAGPPPDVGLDAWHEATAAAGALLERLPEPAKPHRAAAKAADAL